MLYSHFTVNTMTHFGKLLLLGLVTTSLTSAGQNIAATYVVEKTIDLGKSIATLSITAHYYKKGNKYIYWEEPLYLSKYPKGEIEIAEGNNMTIFPLDTDNVQALVYYDYDSLITRQGLFNQYQHFLTEYPFEEKRTEPWIFETETKVINGMKCQLATDRHEWRVWFCPNITVKTSLVGLQGLPGMVIEAYCLPTNEHFTLSTYEMPATIDDKIFMPEIFKQPMVKGELLKSIKASSPKTKLEKQQDLINQNN